MPVVDKIRCLVRELMPVEPGVDSRDDRPRFSAGGRLPGEESGIKFGEGGVELVGVERDDRNDPQVAADLNDTEHFCEKCLGPLVVTPSSGTAEDEVLAAGSDDVRCRVADTHLGDYREFRIYGVASLSESRTHHPPTIVGGNAIGQNFSDGAPIASREVRRETLGHSAGRVFQSSLSWLQFLEAGDRGLEV